MLWLAGLMGVLAACAFSFLAYLLFRRPASCDLEDADDAYEALKAETEALSRLLPAPASHTPDMDHSIAQVEGTDAGSSDPVAASSPAEADAPNCDWDHPAEDKVAAHEADWFAHGGATPDFEDFDPQQDDLVLVWDDSAGAEPRVQVRRCDDNPAVGHVLMDDVIVAQFRTRADMGDPQVSLVPFSRARHLGWAQA